MRRASLARARQWSGVPKKADNVPSPILAGKHGQVGAGVKAYAAFASDLCLLVRSGAILPSGLAPCGAARMLALTHLAPPNEVLLSQAMAKRAERRGSRTD